MSADAHSGAIDPEAAGRGALILDVARHLVPLGQFYFFGGSIDRYALLTAFDLALGLVLIVATTRDKNDVTTVDPRSRTMGLQAISIVMLAAFMGGVALVIAIPIGLPAYMWGLANDLDWRDLLSTRDVWGQVAVMSVLAGFRAHRAFVETTRVGAEGPARREDAPIGDLEGDRRRSLADHAAQVALIATYIGMCYLLMIVSHRALLVLPVLFTGALIFYDARPDVARRLFPIRDSGVAGTSRRRR